MKAEKILVVDDDDTIRIVLSEMLSSIGFDVITANSGENGLSIFFKNNIDFVLSDFQMPGMNGLAFAGRIKESSPLTPVVLMTGAGKGVVFSENHTAVDEVIDKPFTFTALVDTIRNWLGKALKVEHQPFLEALKQPNRQPPH